MLNKISQKIAAAKIFILTILPVLVFALEPMTEGELSTVQGKGWGNGQFECCWHIRSAIILAD